MIQSTFALCECPRVCWGTHDVHFIFCGCMCRFCADHISTSPLLRGRPGNMSTHVWNVSFVEHSWCSRLSLYVSISDCIRTLISTIIVCVHCRLHYTVALHCTYCKLQPCEHQHVQVSLVTLVFQQKEGLLHQSSFQCGLLASTTGGTSESVAS